MILIVDSGSTKTDWCFVYDKYTTHIIQTKGTVARRYQANDRGRICQQV